MEGCRARSCPYRMIRHRTRIAADEGQPQPPPPAAARDPPTRAARLAARPPARPPPRRPPLADTAYLSSSSSVLLREHGRGWVLYQLPRRAPIRLAASGPSCSIARAPTT
eukprot:7871932-Pyramimonas_sp.AAC.1